MIPNMQRKECNTFAEFFERWPYDTTAFHDTVTSNSYICQVSSDDTVIHYNGLAIEDDVLASTQNRLATNFVPRCLKANRNLE